MSERNVPPKDTVFWTVQKWRNREMMAENANLWRTTNIFVVNMQVPPAMFAKLCRDACEFNEKDWPLSIESAPSDLYRFDLMRMLRQLLCDAGFTAADIVSEINAKCKKNLIKSESSTEVVAWTDKVIVKGGAMDDDDAICEKAKFGIELYYHFGARKLTTWKLEFRFATDIDDLDSCPVSEDDIRTMEDDILQAMTPFISSFWNDMKNPETIALMEKVHHACSQRYTTPKTDRCFYSSSVNETTIERIARANKFEKKQKQQNGEGRSGQSYKSTKKSSATSSSARGNPKSTSSKPTVSKGVNYYQNLDGSDDNDGDDDSKVVETEKEVVKTDSGESILSISPAAYLPSQSQTPRRLEPSNRRNMYGTPKM